MMFSAGKSLLSRLMLSVERILSSLRKPALFGICIGIAALMFLLVPEHHKTWINTDYLAQVISLQEGRFLLDEESRLLHKYPPLYPVLMASLSAFSDSIGIHPLFITFPFLCIVLALSSLVIYSISRLTFSHTVSVLAALLFMTHPQILYGLLKSLSAVPFMLFFYLSLYFLCKSIKFKSRAAGNAFGSGVFLGAAMLTRPIALFAPLLCVGIILYFKKNTLFKFRVFYAVLLILGSLLITAPWEFYILSREKRILPLSSAGVYALRDGLSFNHKTYRSPLRLPDDVQAFTDRFWKNYSAMDSPGNIFLYLKEALFRQPVAVVKVYLIKSLRSWYGSDSQNPAKERFNSILFFIYFVPILTGFVFLLKQRRHTDAIPVSILLFTLYFWGMTILALSIVRYMVPVIGLLLIFIPQNLIRLKSLIVKPS